MLVSGIQQSESAIRVHISPLCTDLSSMNIQQSSNFSFSDCYRPSLKELFMLVLLPNVEGGCGIGGPKSGGHVLRKRYQSKETAESFTIHTYPVKCICIVKS